MRRSRGLLAAGILVVLVGGLVGATLWPQQQLLQRTRALAAAELIPQGEALTEDNTVWVTLEGRVDLPVLQQPPETLAGLATVVPIAGGTLLHQGLLVSVEESVDAAGRAVVEMDASLLPLRATPGSMVQLVEVPSPDTLGLLEACGSYLYELRQVSVELTGLPEEVPVLGSAQACEAAEASWSLPERIGEGPNVGGRDCDAEVAEAIVASGGLGTVSERFRRIAELSALAAEEAVADAETFAAEAATSRVGLVERWERLAVVSDVLSGRALEAVEGTYGSAEIMAAGEDAAVVRGLLQAAGDDRAAVVDAAAEALLRAREAVRQSAQDEQAARPHRCVEEDAVPWPAGRGAIGVQILAIRDTVAEIGVDGEHVTGVIEVLRENRAVAYMGPVAGENGPGEGSAQ